MSSPRPHPLPSPASAASAPLRPTVDADEAAHHPRLPPPKRWSSRALFGLEREVEIEHAGQLYRLRQTSLGKLILTK